MNRYWLGVLALVGVLAGCGGGGGDNGGTPSPNTISFNATSVGNGVSVAVSTSGAVPAFVNAVVTNNTTGVSSNSNLSSPDGGITWVGTVSGVAIGPNDTVNIDVRSYAADSTLLSESQRGITGLAGTGGTSGGTTGTTNGATATTGTSTTGTSTTATTTTGTSTTGTSTTATTGTGITTTGTSSGPPPPPNFGP